MKKLLSLVAIFMLLLPTQGFAASPVSDQIIETAKTQIGKPYQFGAPLGDTRSFDCSSFSAYVFGQHGIQLPRISADQAKVGKTVTRSELQKGDLLFYDTDGDGKINHLGVYIAPGQMIHASSSVGVHITSPFNTYWTPRFVTAKRVILENTQSTVQATQMETLHMVKSGDTLFGIANQYGVTIDALKATNQLLSNMVYIGQQLRIPGKTLTSTTGSTTTTYTVKAGDSLWIISRQFNVTVENLMTWNNLQSTTINVGQVLKVAPGVKSYTVKSDDTLWKIATANRTTIQAIIDKNGLKSSTIQPGQTLILP